jgi:L-serine dehydratase
MPTEISVFDLFKIGIGPSSSHTVGPMRAARMFVEDLQTNGALENLTFKSSSSVLQLTGKGHGTDRAILLGLEGEMPEAVDPDDIEARLVKIRNASAISLLKIHPITFDEKRQLIFHHDKSLPLHPNGMRFTAFDSAQKILAQQVYYSVGGGFVVQEQEAAAPPSAAAKRDSFSVQQRRRALQLGTSAAWRFISSCSKMKSAGAPRRNS